MKDHREPEVLLVNRAQRETLAPQVQTVVKDQLGQQDLEVIKAQLETLVNRDQRDLVAQLAVLVQQESVEYKEMLVNRVTKAPLVLMDQQVAVVNRDHVERPEVKDEQAQKATKDQQGDQAQLVCLEREVLMVRLADQVQKVQLEGTDQPDHVERKVNGVKLVNQDLQAVRDHQDLLDQQDQEVILDRMQLPVDQVILVQLDLKVQPDVLAPVVKRERRVNQVQLARQVQMDQVVPEVLPERQEMMLKMESEVHKEGKAPQVLLVHVVTLVHLERLALLERSVQLVPRVQEAHLVSRVSVDQLA